MNSIKPISLSLLFVLLGACALDLKNIGTPDEDGDPIVAVDPTEGPPVIDLCQQAQAGVGEVLLDVAVTPSPGSNQTFAIDAPCVVTERLSAGAQDGLVLDCETDSGAVQLRIQYSNEQLALPASVSVGLAVQAHYVAIENEMRDYAVIVRDAADDHVIVAVHEGPDIVAYQEDVGAIADFWGPIQVEKVATSCEGMMSTCDAELGRGALQFSFEGEAAVVFDHHVGTLGPFGLHLGHVLESLAGGGACDGSSNQTHEFLIVHSPA